MQLRELLGTAELRELLDGESIDQLALELQQLERKYPIKDADGLHDLFLQLGDLSRTEVSQRMGTAPPESDGPNLASQRLDSFLTSLVSARRVFEIRIAGETRLIASEDASRYRDALGIVPPPGLPAAFLEPSESPLADLIGRYARTHIPFRIDDVALRFGMGVASVRVALEELATRDRVVEGEFLPGAKGREWCDTEVLRTLKRRSLAKLRKQVEPVDQVVLARFLPTWQGITRPRKGLDGLLDVIEQLQGVALPASDLERYILPSRIIDFRPSDLDELCASGEVVWRGSESLGVGDGRVALYLTDHLADLVLPAKPMEGELEAQIRELLSRGALFFEELARFLGGFRNDLVDALWRLVWSGEVTNDTLMPLRSLRKATESTRTKSRRAARGFRSRRVAKLPGSEGRWSLLFRPATEQLSSTVIQTKFATQLIERYGVVTREMVASEGLPGGFSGIYPVFKAMEEAGRIRRGYFVAGLGAAQFAAPGAEDRLRDRTPIDELTPTLVIAATDPANPYGAALTWPSRTNDETIRPGRAAGTRVILHGGHLIGFLARKGQHLLTFFPEIEPECTHAQEALTRALAELATRERSLFLVKIDGGTTSASPFSKQLEAAGFVSSSRGLLHRSREK